jgi:isoamylase
MLLMGDEARRTQHGNNNAYCQDNETSWFDWSLVQRHADIHRFVRGLIKLRGLRESVRDAHPLTLAELMSLAQVQLHGVQLAQPDLAHDSHSLAITAASLSGDLRMHFALNAWWQPLAFQLPALPAEAVGGWRRVIDTSRPAPHDLVDPRHGEPVEGSTHAVAERSVVVLFAAVRPTAAMTGPLSGI